MKTVEAFALFTDGPAEIALGVHERFYIYADRESAVKRAQPGERVVKVTIAWEGE